MSSNVKAQSNGTSKAQGEAQGDTSPVEAQAQGTITTEDIAARLNVTAKDLRRWLRARAVATAGSKEGAREALPGKGRRYTFDAPTADAIVAAYGRAKGASGRAVSASAFGLAPVEQPSEGAPRP